MEWRWLRQAQCKSDHGGFSTFIKAQIGAFLLVAVTSLLQLRMAHQCYYFIKVHKIKAHFLSVKKKRQLP